MANYFCILPAPDSHIEFILGHPQSLAAYRAGESPDLAGPTPKRTFRQWLFGLKPEASPPVELPDDWPTSECSLVGDANHRNVDLFHRILNGTDEFVAGGGSLFQTWLESGESRRHSAIDLTQTNDDFAFMSAQVGEVARLLSQVDLEQVREGFIGWLRRRGDVYVPSEAENQQILEEFKQYAEVANEAARRSQGLIIIPS